MSRSDAKWAIHSKFLLGMPGFRLLLSETIQVSGFRSLTDGLSEATNIFLVKRDKARYWRQKIIDTGFHPSLPISFFPAVADHVCVQKRGVELEDMPSMKKLPFLWNSPCFISLYKCPRLRLGR
jgi:hypothetical protein